MGWRIQKRDVIRREDREVLTPGLGLIQARICGSVFPSCFSRGSTSKSDFRLFSVVFGGFRRNLILRLSLALVFVHENPFLFFFQPRFRRNVTELSFSPTVGARYVCFYRSLATQTVAFIGGNIFFCSSRLISPWLFAFKWGDNYSIQRLHSAIISSSAISAYFAPRKTSQMNSSSICSKTKLGGIHVTTSFRRKSPTSPCLPIPKATSNELPLNFS